MKLHNNNWHFVNRNTVSNDQERVALKKLMQVNSHVVL